MARSQTIVIGLLCLLWVASGYGQPPLLQTKINPKTETHYNPCKDSLYLVLSKQDLNSLTDREYEYFMLKEKECSEYQRNGSQHTVKRATSIVKDKESMAYYKMGYNNARKHYDSEGAFLGGMASGCLGGFIGWGIGTAIIKQQDINIPIYESTNMSIADKWEYERGYRAYIKEKKV
ncbi:MAG: hypothetical protein SCARUB_05154 [Candidatus Scalindua rubra]|uniref:Uncharacterized protein n=1 Tax=Candidatus Scalindua rubra TaxID=1872076 RepID=A0A1E3X287_9BACT|nr:MAG: hypothetical protein SCARUB_05154 [Candidatus Scalindua rubra]